MSIWAQGTVNIGRALAATAEIQEQTSVSLYADREGGRVGIKADPAGNRRACAVTHRGAVHVSCRAALRAVGWDGRPGHLPARIEDGMVVFAPPRGAAE